MKKILIVVVLTVFVLSACTSKPANVKVGETLISVKEINFGKYAGSRVTDNKEDLMGGGWEAAPGFRYAELIVEASEGAVPEEVSRWAVTLQDSEGNLYDVTINGWGVGFGGANRLSWTFIIPENANPFKLLFPKGESVDLSHLLTK